MDTAQWPHQDILVRPMDEIVTNKGSSVERKVRPQKEQAVNCPRCNSTNTKFCYYNNYSLSQPRYFCKTCRRYWTEGGSLRNIPVGGGSRKNKRSSSSSNSSKKISDLVPSQQNPKISEPQDLNLGIYSTAPHHHHHPHQLFQLPNFDHHHNSKDLQINPSSSSPSALELLTGITSTTRGLSSFMSMQQTMNHDPNDTNVYTPASSSGFHLPDFRPSLNFSLDGLGSNYGSFQGVEGSSGKHLLFPFEDLKQVSSSTNNNNNANDADHQENGEQNGGAADSTGYWNGVIGGGSW